jgi:hypothetical protein
MTVFQVIQAVRELVILTSSPVTDMLLYCCFCNYNFSLMLLKLLMVSEKKHMAETYAGVRITARQLAKCE